jgi:hypothetical protein
MLNIDEPTQWDAVLVNGKEYCTLSYLLDTYPEHFRLAGCKSHPRRFMEKYGVPETDFIYARLTPKTSKWILSNSTYTRAKPLILLTWIRARIACGMSKSPYPFPPIACSYDPPTEYAMITLLISELPTMYHSTDYYRELIQDKSELGDVIPDDNEITVPSHCTFMQDELSSIDDLTHLLRTMLFWGATITPEMCFRYCSDVTHESIWTPEQLCSNVPDLEKALVYQELLALRMYILTTKNDAYKTTEYFDQIIRAGLHLFSYLLCTDRLLKPKVYIDYRRHVHDTCRRIVVPNHDHMYTPLHVRYGFDTDDAETEAYYTLVAHPDGYYGYQNYRPPRKYEYISCDWNGKVFEKAIAYGSMHCLRYICEHYRTYISSVDEVAGWSCSIVYETEKIEIEDDPFEMYEDNDNDNDNDNINRGVVHIAAKCGNIECLQYLHDNGYKWNSYTIPYAAAGGQLECIKYLRQQKCPDCRFTELAIQGAAIGGHLACIQYLYEHGYSVGTDAIIGAAREGHLNCVQWLYENGCPLDNEVILWDWEYAFKKWDGEAAMSDCQKCFDYLIKLCHNKVA